MLEADIKRLITRYQVLCCVTALSFYNHLNGASDYPHLAWVTWSSTMLSDFMNIRQLLGVIIHVIILLLLLLTFIIKETKPHALGQIPEPVLLTSICRPPPNMFRFGERIKFCHPSQEKVGEPIAVSSPSARSESLGQRSQWPCFWRNLVLQCWERGRPEWALLWWAGLEWGVGMGRRPCPVRGLSLLCVVGTAAVPVKIRGDLPICFCFSLCLPPSNQQ